ncbi:MAG: TRAP transporter fused permease subunit [Pseudomonadota bacterium]
MSRTDSHDGPERERLAWPKPTLAFLSVGLAGYTLWIAGPGLAPDHVRLSVYLAVTWVLVLFGFHRETSADTSIWGLWPALYALGATVFGATLVDHATSIVRDGVTVFDMGYTIGLAVCVGLAARSKEGRNLVLVGFALIVILYVLVHYLTLVNRAGAWTPSDVAVATIAFFITLEVARRGLGLAIPIIALFAVGYAYFGQQMPDAIAHRGVRIERILNYTLYSQEGVYGIMTSVMANIVLMFILLAAFMNRSGMGRFFIDFPMALAGRSAGGPAKVAVFASGVFGSISGSSLANIVSTGTFTIPLMKRVGFRAAVAGAVENSASLGGQLLPPVMGAGVFVMAEITGIPYVEIIAVATIPALLYFASIILIVHFEAKRNGIGGVADQDAVRPLTVLRAGWFHTVPFVVLVGSLIAGFSPDRCALAAILTILAINWIRVVSARLLGTAMPEFVFGLKGLVVALTDGVRNSLVIGAIAACIGIIVGMIALTGFGLKISLILVDAAGGSLLLTLILLALCSLVLGMALPITAAYLVLIVLAAPALETLGVPLIAAHLIVFWLSQDSNITPPVCIGAFVAASIADAKPWPTAWLSFRFAKMLYVMPLLFAFTPILFTGTVLGAVWTIAFATVGTCAFAAWTQGYLLARANRLTGSILAVSAGCCFLPYDLALPGAIPGAAANIFGAVLLVLLAVWQWRESPRSSLKPT